MQWQTEIINGNQVTFFRYDDPSGKNSGIEYLATRDENGKFHVNTHDGCYKNVPFVGNFKNYREMDTYFDRYVHLGVPIVCHVSHNAPNAYVLMLPNGSHYIRIEE